MIWVLAVVMDVLQIAAIHEAFQFYWRLPISRAWKEAVTTPVLILAFWLALAPGVLWIEAIAFRIEGQARNAGCSFFDHAKNLVHSSLPAFLPILAWFMISPFLPDIGLWLYLAILAFLLIFAAGAPFLIETFSRTRAPADRELTDRIEKLCKKAGLRPCAIRILHGRGEKTANAMVAGILPIYRRIYLTDYLLKCLSPDEIEAVTAHEIGHILAKHLWGYVLFSIIYAIITPFVLGALFFLPVYDNAPIWLVVLTVFVWMDIYFVVIFGIFSRGFEKSADARAVALTGDKAAYLRMLEKLGRLNHMPKNWDRTDIAQTHPSIQRRMDDVMATLKDDI